MRKDRLRIDCKIKIEVCKKFEMEFYYLEGNITFKDWEKDFNKFYSEKLVDFN